jgi:uncharacterized protein (TIGR01777 family)
MGGEIFERRTRLAVSAEQAYAWHARPGAFERLAPPWARVDVLEREGDLLKGRVVLRLWLGAVPVTWVARMDGGEAGRSFRDVLVRGPFSRWVHEHRFEPDGPHACRLVDRIEYAAPAFGLGAAALRRRLERLFAWRHHITAADLAQPVGGEQAMTLLITGSRGLIGSALVPALTVAGHTVRRLVRGAARSDDEASWDPERGELDAATFAGVDAVIHLAGESLAARWTPELKRRILDSRVLGTSLLARTLAGLDTPPKVLVSASAVGWYGERGAEECDETSARGNGFLSDVCAAWEDAAEPAREAGIRVVHPRLGVVLSPRGGALAKMLPAFRCGVGGRLGTGRQWWSWISLDDVLGGLGRAAADEGLSGAVNLTAPAPATNEAFTIALARALRRPAVLPMPAFAARLAFGEMGEALLLGGQRVLPRKLLDAGYAFRDADLKSALTRLLGSPS